MTAQEKTFISEWIKKHGCNYVTEGDWDGWGEAPGLDGDSLVNDLFENLANNTQQ